MKHREVAEKLRKYVDRAYRLGGSGDAWDCLSLILEFYEDCGVVMPAEFRGFTRDNYAGRWERGAGRDELRDFLLSLGEEVHRNYARIGDLLLFQGEEHLVARIYLGNGHVLRAHPKGMRVVPLKFCHEPLIGARRCI